MFFPTLYLGFALLITSGANDVDNNQNFSVLHLTSESSHCRNEDESINVSVACTITCSKGAPYIFLYHTSSDILAGFSRSFYNSTLHRIYKPSECSDNITMVVNGSITKIQRKGTDNECVYPIKCSHPDDTMSSLEVSKTVAFNDCSYSMVDNCIHSTHTTVLPAPTLTSDILSSSTVSIDQPLTTLYNMTPSPCICSSYWMDPVLTTTVTVMSGSLSISTVPCVTVTSTISPVITTSTTQSVSTIFSSVSPSPSTSLPPIVSTLITVVSSGSGAVLMLIITLLVISNVVVAILLIRSKRKQKRSDNALNAAVPGFKNPTFVN